MKLFTLYDTSDSLFFFSFFLQFSKTKDLPLWECWKRKKKSIKIGNSQQTNSDKVQTTSVIPLYDKQKKKKEVTLQTTDKIEFYGEHF